MTEVNERAKAMELIHHVPDTKIGYVIAYLQGLMAGEDSGGTGTVEDCPYPLRSREEMLRDLESARKHTEAGEFRSARTVVEEMKERYETL